LRNRQHISPITPSLISIPLLSFRYNHFRAVSVCDCGLLHFYQACYTVILTSMFSLSNTSHPAFDGGGSLPKCQLLRQICLASERERKPRSKERSPCLSNTLLRVGTMMDFHIALPKSHVTDSSLQDTGFHVGGPQHRDNLASTASKIQSFSHRCTKSFASTVHVTSGIHEEPSQTTDWRASCNRN